MKCPLRMKAFDQPDTCDKDCAWLIRLVNPRKDPQKMFLACAVAVNASDCGIPKGPANWMEES